LRYLVTVVDGRVGRSMDTLLDADPGQPMAQVLPALVGVLGGDVHPSFAARTAASVDGRPVEQQQTLADAGLRHGSVVELHEVALAAGEPRGVAELRVVGGPGAGRVHRIGLGETWVGCGASGLSLPDLLLPADALRVLATPDGRLDVTPAAGLEATLAGDPITETAPWPLGEYLVAGETVLHHTAVGVQPAEAERSQDYPGTDVVRPPRLLPPPREAVFTLPTEPGERPKQSIPWLMVFAPMLMAVPMYFFWGPRAIIFALMSPVLAIANVITSRRGSRKQHAEAKKKYQADLADVEERIATGLLSERDARRDLGLDPAAVLLTALGPGRRLWERRRTDPDHLVLRLGLADLPASLTVKHPRLDQSKPEPPARTLADVPASLALRELGVVGLAGPDDARQAVARWLVAQAAVLHSPRDVRIVLLCDTDGGPVWGWVRWLPHLRAADDAGPLAVGTDQESIGRRLAELTQLVTDRQGSGSGSGGEAGAGRPRLTPAPDLLVVLDGARRLRALPGVVQLLRQGPAVGVHLICLDDETRQLPEECRGVVECGEHGRVDLRRTGAEDVLAIRPDLVEVTWAGRLARALAPLRDTTPDVEDTGVPSSARLLEVTGLEPPTADAVLARWASGRTTDVVVGAGFDGAFRLDLRRDGPHALVAGTTGSGKSELLQSLVAALAIANRPDQLTFVLIDYKGGSAFKDCARLPHTVGMVTDLDDHLVSRALVSLGAELRRREHLLAGPGAKDLEDYWALQDGDPGLPPMPRLVLVIDEFASLAAELPDFVTGLVSIAQRGRSLGLHLVLATQRPTGVVSPEIRANTNLRIALRVTDDAESRDVLDAPDAARITRATPGRGYVRTGHSSLMPFQAGRIGGRRPGQVTGPVTPPDPLAWPVPWPRAGLAAPARPTVEGATTDEGATDLSLLVEVLNETDRRAGVAAQPAPWLLPLPEVITLAALGDGPGEVAPGGPATTGLGEVALGGAATGLGEVGPGGPGRPAPKPVPASGALEPAPWALEDHPADQQQRSRTFGLGRDGHLYVIGGPRSGRSTVLRTLAASLAERVPASDLHLYGLDCGNGALLPLTALAHTGAVVQRTQTERVDRLLLRIADEVADRQDLLGEKGFADVAEQRAACPPGERLPYLMLLLDRWEGFVSTLGEADGGRLIDEMIRLLREGASAGLHLVISGDRSLLAGRMAPLVEDKLVLRLPDRNDYGTASIPLGQVPDTVPDGRGLWAESAVEAQVATLGPDLTGAGQGAAVRDLAASLAERDGPTPAGRAPFRLAPLPTLVPAAEALDQLDLRPPGTAPADPLDPTPDGRPRLWFPIGVGGDDLDLLGVDLGGAAVAMVAGLAGSGRTNVLRLCAEVARRRGQPTLAVCARPNALSADLGAAAVVGTSETEAAVMAGLQGLTPSSLVLVDDAEMFRDKVMVGLLLSVVRQAAEKGWALVVAGQAADLAADISGWLGEARRGRQGLLLSPTSQADAGILATRLSRSHLTTRVQPGRGVLARQGMGAVAVQVPLL
jgi:DNA segregation ATPase FtsK/SpoIIIE, S-DNA-T family